MHQTENNRNQLISFSASVFLSPHACSIQHLFGNRVGLNPGLGGVRDVASAIISMNRLNKTDFSIFKLWMLCFQRISSDYLELTTAVVVTL